MRRYISDRNGFEHLARDMIGSDTDGWTENELDKLIENITDFLREHYHNQGFRYGDDIQDFEDISQEQFEALVRGI